MKVLIASVLIILAVGLGVLFFLDASQHETMILGVDETNSSSPKSTNHRRTKFDDTLNSENETNEKEQSVIGNKSDQLKKKSELSTTPVEASRIADAKSPEQAELDGWYEGFREKLFQNISNAYESQPEEGAKLLKHINHLDSRQNSSNPPSLNPLIKPKYYQDFYIDDEWATQVESELRAFILSQSLDENFKLIDIVCKQLVCRLYYGGLDGIDSSKLHQAVLSYIESLYFIDYFGVRNYESRTAGMGFGMANSRMFQYQQISFESHHKR